MFKKKLDKKVDIMVQDNCWKIPGVLTVVSKPQKVQAIQNLEENRRTIIELLKQSGSKWGIDKNNRITVAFWDEHPITLKINDWLEMYENHSYGIIDDEIFRKTYTFSNNYNKNKLSDFEKKIVCTYAISSNRLNVNLMRWLTESECWYDIKLEGLKIASKEAYDENGQIIKGNIQTVPWGKECYLLKDVCGNVYPVDKKHFEKNYTVIGKSEAKAIKKSL